MTANGRLSLPTVPPLPLPHQRQRAVNCQEGLTGKSCVTSAESQYLNKNRHLSVPTFGYQLPNAAASRPPPPRSATKPPNASSHQASPTSSIPKDFERAEAAGRAAAKRMDELQGASNKSTKPFLYQNYGFPSPQPNAPTQLSATSSSPAATASATCPDAETAGQKRARLHKLFNTWVPRAVEFYNSYDTLDLTAEEIKAIQDEIVRYRVKSAQAPGKRTPYQAEWETAQAHLPPQPQDDEEDDPLGLGLPRAIVEGRHTGEVDNLLD